MKRREVLHTVLASGAVSSLLARAGEAEENGTAGPLSGIVDSNVNLFHWPFRRLPLDETEKLVEKLRSLGIVEALAGSHEGLLHRDLSAVNARLAEACGNFSELLPVGSVNPALPDWERDFLRCVQDHGMRAIRLHPNYHGYALDDARFARLLVLAGEAGILVQIAVSMEDTRTQHDLVRVDDVDTSPLPEVLARAPGCRVQLLNFKPRVSIPEALASSPSIYFDIARVEGTDGVSSLIAATSPSRVLFGSHAPFLIPEAALIRVHESDLSPPELRSLLRETAASLVVLPDA